MRRALWVRSGRLAIGMTMLWASLAAGQAPESRNPGELQGKKRVLFAALGMLVAGVPAYVSSESAPSGGNCSSQSCVTALAVVIGGTAGFLIGLDYDRKYTRRLASGPTLEVTTPPTRIPLTLAPERMTGFEAGAVVTGSAGANLVYEDGRVLPRATGIRGIEDAAVLPQQDLVVFATASGLLAFPLSGDSVRGSLLDRTGGSALETVDADLAVGDASEIRILRVESVDGVPSAERVAAVASGGLVTDLTWSPFGRVAWALVESRLVGFAPGTLEPLGSVDLPGPGLVVRVRGDRAIVASGSQGVVLVDIADPTAPRVVQVIGGMRFAYSADLAADRLHVAAGSEGVVVVDLSDETAPSVIGVLRTVGFARDLFAEGRRLWVLDRLGRKVEIADLPAAETAAR